ncbi:MAG: hypothetical protein HZB57_11785 [Gammaproteobacteria bacterium]|nr:hypothetical protein [Gammaproteobacteria bacterium]
MTSRLTVLVVVVASLAAVPANAQPYVYPAKGQSAQQQKQDEYQCYDWARQQSGYDPMQAASQPAPAQAPAPTGGRLRGALRGAAGGAVIGEIANDDAGKGAAVGAVAGTMVGGARQRQAQAQQQAQVQQQQAASAQQQQGYQRAYGACLEGRGYTVK